MREFIVTDDITLIPIGKKGEVSALKVIFPIKQYKEKYGDSGTFNLLHQRNTDTQPYPCTVTLNEDKLEWVVSNADNDKEGYGQCELVYNISSTVAKSCNTWDTEVRGSLGSGTTPPQPQATWVQQVLDAKDDAEDARDEAIEAKEYIEDLDATASVDANVGTPSVTVTKSTVEEHDRFAFDFHNLKGANGTNGSDGRGIVSIAKTGTVGLVDTYTISYTDGTTSSYNVTNGSGGASTWDEIQNKPTSFNPDINGLTSDSVLSNSDKFPFYNGTTNKKITFSNLTSMLNFALGIDGKQDVLTAGTNITIANDVISAEVGGDIIQDPDDASGGIVTASTLADIDPTLSLQGDGADAKATGDAITQLNNDIANKISGAKLGGTQATVDSDKNIVIPSNCSGSTAQNTVLGVCGIEYGQEGGISAERNTTSAYYGAIRIRMAQHQHINSRTETDYYDSSVRGANRCFPIVPAQLDYAVKRAMTDGVGSAWTDTEKNGAWARLNIIKTTMDNVAVANAQYDLGEQSTLTITLPSATSMQEIYVAFKSGATATTLNIVGSYEGDTSYVPSANKICELHFKYVCSTWVLVTKETSVTV